MFAVLGIGNGGSPTRVDVFGTVGKESVEDGLALYPVQIVVRILRIRRRLLIFCVQTYLFIQSVAVVVTLLSKKYLSVRSCFLTLYLFIKFVIHNRRVGQWLGRVRFGNEIVGTFGFRIPAFVLYCLSRR